MNQADLARQIALLHEFRVELETERDTEDFSQGEVSDLTALYQSELVALGRVGR